MNAKVKKDKKDQLTAEERRSMAELETLQKQIGDKTPNETQKKRLAELKEDLAKRRFVRVANKRIPKTLKAIRNIGNLSGPGYSKTDVQIKAICEALDTEVRLVKQKLAGTKEIAPGFSVTLDPS